MTRAASWSHFRSHNPTRIKNREHDCAYVQFIDAKFAAPAFHRCDLARYHIGAHICWCGWTFGSADDHSHQRMLPGLDDAL